MHHEHCSRRLPDYSIPTDIFVPRDFCSFSRIANLDDSSAVAAQPLASARRRGPMQGIAAELQVAVVEIGGLPVRLFTDNASFLETARERYGSLLRPGNQAGIDLTIDLAPPGILSAQEDVCVTRQSTRRLAGRGDFHVDWES